MQRIRISQDLGRCVDGNFQQHYAAPIVTTDNVVIVAADCSRILLAIGPDNSTVWSLATGFLMPASNWYPHYQVVLAGSPGPTQRVYFPGKGGGIRWRDNLASADPLSEGIAYFFGEAIYGSNRSFYDAEYFVNSAIVAYNGAVYFTVRIQLDQLADVLVRYNASAGTFIIKTAAEIGGAGYSRFPHQYAPAFSNEFDLMYVLVGTSTIFGGGGRIVAVSPMTLSVLHSAFTGDPRNPSSSCLVFDDSTASPTVAPDGDVFLGMLGFAGSGSSFRNLGWLLHWNKFLNVVKTPGGFGWDDTATIVNASSASDYTGASSYLLFVKYNDYVGVGQGLHQLALLDPNDLVELDPQGSGVTVMRRVQTVLAPTPVDVPIDGYPDARKEWCVNSGSYDPFQDSIYANSEDSYQYRWHLPSNTLAESFLMDTAQVEAYTPTAIGPDGAIYAINKGKLFVFDGQGPMTGTGPSTSSSSSTTTTSTPAQPRACKVHEIQLGCNFFNPNSVVVQRGDIIIWNWVCGFHNIVQLDGPGQCMPSAIQLFGVPNITGETGRVYNYSVVLADGTYYYTCEPHCTFMQSTLTVDGECTSVKSPDIDGNGTVDLLDLLIIINWWGPCPVLSGAPCRMSDLNNDGQVDLFDVLTVIENWGPLFL